MATGTPLRGQRNPLKKEQIQLEQKRSPKSYCPVEEPVVHCRTVAPWSPAPVFIAVFRAESAAGGERELIIFNRARLSSDPMGTLILTILRCFLYGRLAAIRQSAGAHGAKVCSGFVTQNNLSFVSRSPQGESP
jgi:hypothetical protein